MESTTLETLVHSKDIRAYTCFIIASLYTGSGSSLYNFLLYITSDKIILCLMCSCVYNLQQVAHRKMRSDLLIISLTMKDKLKFV